MLVMQRPGVVGATPVMARTFDGGSNVAQSNCIETTWGRTRDGYGKAMRDKRYWLAHRYAWTQANGPIPPGMVVMHRCDNPPCVNVAHLMLGTQQDNIADRQRKQRMSVGVRNNGKLDDDKVREIRSSPHISNAEFGRRFGVAAFTVSQARSGTKWRAVA